MMRRRTALTLSMAAAVSACATPKPKIVGAQIPVLPPTNSLDVSADAPAVTTPPAMALAEWPQVLAGPAHAPGNIAGPNAMTRRWQAVIGAPGGLRQPLQASPVAAGGRVFTMDAGNAIAAFSLVDGAPQWRTPTRPKHVTMQPLGGGIGYADGAVYAATGFGELLSIDAGSGKINWRQALDYPARSAPTIAGGIVSLVTQNDLLLTFDPANGTPGWRFIGKVSDTITSVVVTGAPAYDSGILVAGFASGTLAALDVGSGTPVWEQSMASSFGQASPLDFSDVVAPPVIAGGVVYAVGLGQTSLAIDLRSGAKVWERDVNGTQAFCLAGEFGYLLDSNQQLAAIHADDGLVTWISQLPNFRNMKKKNGGPRSFNGPVMVNGHLLFTTSRGELVTVDPVTGAVGTIGKPGVRADLAPIVADGVVLVLARDATLTAYS